VNDATTTGGGGLIEVPDGTWPVVALARELARAGAHVTLELRLGADGGVERVDLAPPARIPPRARARGRPAPRVPSSPLLGP